MLINQRRTFKCSALAQVSTALAIGLSSLAIVGCDTDSDRTVRTHVQEAIDLRAVHSKEANEQAQKKLDELSTNNNAAPATRAQLAAMRGQMRVDAALDLMRDIDRKELELTRVAFDLNQLAVQLDAGSTVINGFKKFDPAPQQQSIAQQITAAQGGPDKLTWEFQGLQLPTIEGTRQNIAKYEADIQKLQEQVQTLTTQRDAAMKDAEAAQKSSDEKKGREAVDEFRRATMLRKDAGELFTKIDQTNAQMVPLQRDLAVAQGQLQTLEEVVKQLQAQNAALDAGWKSMQEQIATQSQLAQKIVGAEGAAAPAPTTDETAIQMSGASMAAKAAEINTYATQLKEMRGQAQSHLDEAAREFQAAYTNADAVRKDLAEKIGLIQDRNRADYKTLQNAQDIMNPQVYQLREAGAHRLTGALYASQAASLMNRLNLKASVVPIIQRAGATVPAILRPENLDKEMSQASKLAAQAYEDADKMLGNVREGTALIETKNAATVEQILTNYGWAQVLKADGDAKGAKEKLDKAIALRDGAAEAKIKLPVLPAELGPTPGQAPPATAPSETPATAPAAPQDSPEAAGAREVLNKYVTAVTANDQDAIKAIVTVESGAEADFEQQLKLLADVNKLKDAVATKMGEDAAKQFQAGNNVALAMLQNAPITVSGDEGSMTLPVVGAKKMFVRADGQWKLFFGAPANDAEKAQRAALAKLDEALPQITSDVEAGTIKDMQGLQAAIVKAMQPG